MINPELPSLTPEFDCTKQCRCEEDESFKCPNLQELQDFLLNHLVKKYHLDVNQEPTKDGLTGGSSF